MYYHSSTPSAFRRRHLHIPPRTVLSNPPSSWSAPQLIALHTLCIPGFPPVLAPYRPERLPDFLLTQLRLFSTSSFEIPRDQLPKATNLYQFYSALATVLERSADAPSGFLRDGERRERTQARRATGFVNSEYMELSHSGSDSECLSLASSISVKESEADRSKDERAVTALANVFLQDILAFGEVGDAGDGRKVEWTPVARRMQVAGQGWQFVANDYGGLVLREFVGGSWRSGAYVTNVECKSRVEGMHGVRAVAQHVAELLGGLQSTGIDTGEGPFVIGLICFAQSKMAVKMAVVDRSYREWLYSGPEPCPVLDNVDMGAKDENEDMEQYGGEDDGGAESDDDEEQDDGQEMAEDQQEYPYLRVYHDPVRDLARGAGRVAAGMDIISIARYCGFRAVEERKIQSNVTSQCT
ncbi:hypothetical protein Q9L58_000625 [Maublancomyces gigas]|uniref:Uncharacterized protein n=1 Tax=Discina gigas TaxID=1032678 RepID=A0ABR3GWT6_9PEZI